MIKTLVVFFGRGVFLESKDDDTDAVEEMVRKEFETLLRNHFDYELGPTQAFAKKE